jgi:cytidine deaminase
MDAGALELTVAAGRDLISERFEDDEHHGAAAMPLADGTILTGTAPEPANPAVALCHEVERLCGAFRPGQQVRASVCLRRLPGGRIVVVGLCGLCRERLAMHGPEVPVVVADPSDATMLAWKPLSAVLPDYWMTAFPDEVG